MVAQWLKRRFKTWALNIRDRVSLVKYGSSVVEAPLQNLGKFVYPTDETLKAVGPFYLVSMPGEAKYPTQGLCVTCRGPHILA